MKKLMKKLISSAVVLVLIMSFSVPVLATEYSEKPPAEVEIPGQGYISDDTGDTNVMVDIIAPASFLWYADQNTYNTVNYDIVSGEFKLVNTSETVDLKVDITGYSMTAAGTNPIVEADVELNLAGDFDGYWDDIFDNPLAGSNTIPISETLASANGAAVGGSSTMTIEFDGIYIPVTLPSTPLMSHYTLSLRFEVNGISD
jgi:hypothetical protein